MKNSLRGSVSLLLATIIWGFAFVSQSIAMANVGLGMISFGAIAYCIFAAAAAFAGVFLAIKVMRMLAVNIGFNAFAFYNLGLALFSFILFLTA